MQLYLRARESGITRRLAELKAFQKLELFPGEERVVSFTLGREELAIWNREMRFAVEPCRVSVLVGGNSKDTLGKELTITAVR